MKPEQLTEVELNELADLLLNDDIGFGVETIEEARETARSYPTAKFSKYITDGPGYVGDLYVLVGGIPRASVIIRDTEGKMKFSDD